MPDKIKTLTDEQIDQITKEVEDITVNNSKSVDELYATIGNAIHYSSDVQLAPESSKTLLQDVETNQHPIALSKALRLLSGTPSLSFAAAVEGGGNFWQRLKGKIRNVVCSNEIIKTFFTNAGALKDVVTVLVPIILGALGISAINPLLLAALVAVISLLIKEGYPKFCAA